ncbi:hypothetical protein AB1Y20_004382 [Prymnesium parvum]|uniref:Uncharacterized protein n=1 Tax=Prymnesium parvum TaxID=97485 RepID=A0AB34IYL9_PRYPA
MKDRTREAREAREARELSREPPPSYSRDAFPVGSREGLPSYGGGREALRELADALPLPLAAGAHEAPRSRIGSSKAGSTPSIPTSPLRKKRLPALSGARQQRWEIDVEAVAEPATTCLCPPLTQLPAAGGAAGSKARGRARESSRRSARRQRDALQDVSEVYQARGPPPSCDSRPDSRAGRPPSRTGSHARPRTAKSLERGRRERSTSRERASAGRSTSLERVAADERLADAAEAPLASEERLGSPPEREERGALARVMEEPPSPSPMLRTLVIESALPQIGARASLPEQARALSQLLRLDFESRDALVTLQRLTERGLAFVRDLSDYAEVLGVPASTILQQILLTRLDVDEASICSSGGPLTGISRSAYVETFEKEDVASLQAEAKYLSSAFALDLHSKAGLPRARSNLASCAALLTAVWDAVDETGRSGSELLREWSRGRKCKGG